MRGLPFQSDLLAFKYIEVVLGENTAALTNLQVERMLVHRVAALSTPY